VIKSLIKEDIKIQFINHLKVISAKLQWNAKSKVDSFGRKDEKKPAQPEQRIPNPIEHKQERV